MSPGPTSSRPTGTKAAAPSAATRARSQDDAIIEVTWCYYQEGMNQNEIAERLGISRATVVNYLSEARKRDYVRITLDTDIFRDHDLARRLVDRFGLQDAIVVPTSPPGQTSPLTGSPGWLPTGCQACWNRATGLALPGAKRSTGWRRPRRG